MSDIKLTTDTHDLDVTDQALSLVVDEVDSPEAITQELRIALRFVRGEWALNVLVGIPYYTEVFIKNPSLAAIATLFTRAIRSVPGIIEVPELTPTFDNSTRQLAIDFSAKAQNGGVIEDRLAVVL